MAGLTVKVTGNQAILDGLTKMNPGLNRKITDPAMLEAALTITRTAGQKHIVRGGAKGSPARSKILTSRTGRLRGSLTAAKGGVDKSKLPRRIEAGSNVVYAGHETGGPVTVGASTVRAHTRNKAFGKKVKPFTVKRHTRRGHTKTVPKRPYLAPALAEVAPQIPSIFTKHWRLQLP